MKKLRLNKKTISILEMNQVRGGGETTAIEEATKIVQVSNNCESNIQQNNENTGKFILVAC